MQTHDFHTAPAPALFLSSLGQEAQVLVAVATDGFFAGATTLPLSADPVALAAELGLYGHLLSEVPSIFLCMNPVLQRYEDPAQAVVLRWTDPAEALHALSLPDHRRLLASTLTLLLPPAALPASLAA